MDPLDGTTLTVACLVRDAQGWVAQAYVDVDRALRAPNGDPVPGNPQVLFVDLGSRDRTCALLEGYRGKDPRLEVLALPRGTPRAHVLQAVAEAARGDRVVVVPGPGALDADALARILRDLTRCRATRARGRAAWGFRRDPAVARRARVA